MGAKQTTRRSLAAGLIAAACSGAAGTAAADGMPLAWKRQPGTRQYDDAWAVATDPAGDVYVVGETSGSLGGAKKGLSDAWVRKYDPSGRVLWQRQPGTSHYDRAYAVATHADGHVYVAGRTNGSLGGDFKGGSSDAWVGKYDPAGRPLWRRQLGRGGTEAAYAVATDPGGNVYLAGWTTGSVGGENKGDTDAWVAKYDPSGQLLWQAQPGTSAADGASGVATDASGNVYLVGWSWGSLAGGWKGRGDAWIRKYDPSGRLLWQRQPGTAVSESTSAAAIDTGGNVYAVGTTEGSLAGALKGQEDAWIRKYDPSGRLLWQRQPGTTSNDLAYAVATDAAGYVYLAGMTQGSLAGTFKGGSADAWVRKYDPLGRLLWQRQPGTSAADYAYGVATDPSGGVYLVGRTDGSLGGENKGDADGWIMKFAPVE